MDDNQQEEPLLIHFNETNNSGHTNLLNKFGKRNLINNNQPQQPSYNNNILNQIADQNQQRSNTGGNVINHNDLNA